MRVLSTAAIVLMQSLGSLVSCPSMMHEYTQAPIEDTLHALRSRRHNSRSPGGIRDSVASSTSSLPECWYRSSAFGAAGLARQLWSAPDPSTFDNAKRDTAIPAGAWLT
ncbi:hypothetical protein C8Q70DRAFT_216562 [Cubamyces menziesii]|nr:hypothetical protein C8Q70DRAFT_216562 [Cubamyces menziesii]